MNWPLAPAAVVPCSQLQTSFHWEELTPYLKFVTSTTSGAGVKIFRPVSKKCELVCFSVKIMNFVFFGVKKSGIGVFLVSVENGAGVKKMTNFRYVIWLCCGNLHLSLNTYFWVGPPE